MTLFEMLTECVNARYSHVGDCADYALDYRDGILYVYFEKSNGVGDWEVNLDFPAKPYKRMGTRVWLGHRGFIGAWKEIEDRLAPVLLDKDVKRIVTVGYSHGAALAVLCHEYIWWNREDLRQELRGYGYGAPRVLWGSISRRCARRWDGFTVIRCVPDLVTHLPPAAFGYFHVGKMLEVGERVKYSPVEAHKFETYLKELYRLEHLQI